MRGNYKDIWICVKSLNSEENLPGSLNVMREGFASDLLRDRMKGYL